jgi:hypothetical protein
LPDNSFVPAQIGFCESHHRSFDSEVSQNLQMLFSLRHPAVVGSNDQKREIDRADARNHVSNKIFVTGDIDDSDVEPLLVRPGEIQLCEPEVDRDLSLLFLRQPIGVCSCERFYQRTFAVIDMPGRRQDEMFRCHYSRAKNEQLTFSRHPERSEGPLTG